MSSLDISSLLFSSFSFLSFSFSSMRILVLIWSFESISFTSMRILLLVCSSLDSSSFSSFSSTFGSSFISFSSSIFSSFLINLSLVLALFIIFFLVLVDFGSDSVSFWVPCCAICFNFFFFTIFFFRFLGSLSLLSRISSKFLSVLLNFSLSSKIWGGSPATGMCWVDL